MGEKEENDDLWTMNDERKEANALFCRFNPFMTGSYPPFLHPGPRSGTHSPGSRPQESESGAVCEAIDCDVRQQPSGS